MNDGFPLLLIKPQPDSAMKEFRRKRAQEAEQ